MKRIAVVSLIAGLLVVAGLSLATHAGANSPGQPVLTVDSTNATLQIPDPACRPQGCQWGLFIFKIAPDGTQTLDGNGSAGVGDIVVPLPLNFCGMVQIDYGVFSDNGVFHKDVGHKYEVSTCETPTTTTTIGCPPNDTPPPCDVTTTTPPTTQPPDASPTTTTSVPGSSAPTITAVPAPSPVTPASTPPNPGQLPDIQPGPVTAGNG